MAVQWQGMMAVGCWGLMWDTCHAPLPNRHFRAIFSTKRVSCLFVFFTLFITIINVIFVCLFSWRKRSFCVVWVKKMFSSKPFVCFHPMWQRQKDINTLHFQQTLTDGLEQINTDTGKVTTSLSNQHQQSVHVPNTCNTDQVQKKKKKRSPMEDVNNR